MQSIYKQLCELRSCTGANDKISYLKGVDEDFKKYLLYVLDPYKMYGVKVFEPMSCQEPLPEEALTQSLFDLLDQLRKRGAGGRAFCSDWTRHGGEPELLQCALTKDLRAGVQATTVNKMFPGFIPEFKVALAEEFEPEKVTYPVYVSTKYDGLRALAFVNTRTEEVVFKTRNGLEITSVPNELKLELLERTIAGMLVLEEYYGNTVVFDGEILTGDFLESVSALRKKDKEAKDAKYYTFDILSNEQFVNRSSTLPQINRTIILEKFFATFPGIGSVFLVKEEICWNEAEVMEAYKKRIDGGMEGVIVKNQSSPYQFRRSKAWTKIKDIQTFDLEIIGVEEGKGKYTGTLGALILNHNGVSVKASGMTDNMRNHFWYNSPIGQIAEVDAQEVTRDGSLRHPRFIRLREDK